MSDINTTQREYIQISGTQDVKKKTRIYWQNNLDSVLIDKPTESSAPAYSQLTQFAEPTIRNLIEKLGTGAFSNIVLNGNATNLTSSKQVSFYAPDLSPGRAHDGYLGIPVWRYSAGHTGGSWEWTDAQNLVDGTVLTLRINDVKRDVSLTTIYAPESIPTDGLISGKYYVPRMSRVEDGDDVKVLWNWVEWSTPLLMINDAACNLFNRPANPRPYAVWAPTHSPVQNVNETIAAAVPIMSYDGSPEVDGSASRYNWTWKAPSDLVESVWDWTKFTKGFDGSSSIVGKILVYAENGNPTWTSIEDILKNSSTNVGGSTGGSVSAYLRINGENCDLSQVDSNEVSDYLVYAPTALPSSLDAGQLIVPVAMTSSSNAVTWEWRNKALFNTHLILNGSDLDLTAGTHDGWYKIYAPTDAPPKDRSGKVPVATYDWSTETYTWNWVEANRLNGSDDGLGVTSAPLININGVQCNLFDLNEENMSPHSVCAPVESPTSPTNHIPVCSHSGGADRWTWADADSFLTSACVNDVSAVNPKNRFYAPTASPSSDAGQVIPVATTSSTNEVTWEWGEFWGGTDVFVASESVILTDSGVSLTVPMPRHPRDSDDVIVELSLNTLASAGFDSAKMSTYAQIAPYVSGVSISRVNDPGAIVDILPTTVNENVVYPLTVKVTVCHR